MTIDQYIANITNRYRLGNATEHTFRGDLQQLIETIVPDVRATNEPKRQTCGAPDYILTRGEIPVGFIEAKDIGDKDLQGAKKTGNKEQFDRYKASLPNILFTDYLDFRLYRDGQFVTSISIGELEPLSPGRGVGVRPISENFTAFTNLLRDFCTHISQTIKSSKRLAELMAGKARLLADVIEKALNSDETNSENSTLKEQMLAFKEILIHDITPKAFADVYAQTIAYGMFAARLHDPTLPTFSRQEAAELIPKSNPFLRKLFGYIAGPDIDDRIKWIVDSLVEVFLACNVEELLKNYGKSTRTEDPIIHFYETFLSKYDASLRKARGVWYTPHPVVSFIVRAVDDILKTEFNLPQGLADTSKTKIKVNLQATDKRYTNNIKTTEEEVHRVQILDPATGTGTFLAEVVKHIHQRFAGQQGIWSNYVEKHLLPRLNGFELLMASYAMAHLQLDLLLTETGYRPTTNQRFKVFLTNSLEESHPDTGTLFANWLSSEANEANQIKRDTPVMCVIGNPPYSVSSSNKSIDSEGKKTWIGKLIDDYKKDLNEKNIQPLSDDYIKFIRYGQHFIDKNGSGVLAYISNNSFLDGIIHRQMRKHLLESFDKIYIIDLHGDSNKRAVTTDGLSDQNVFDIMQGVSINIFIKTTEKKNTDFGKVFYTEIQGNRQLKYQFLKENFLGSLKWNLLPPNQPNYFFVKKDFQGKEKYESFLKLDKLFIEFSGGVQTKRDKLFLDDCKEDLNNRINKLLSQKYEPSFISEFNINNSSSYFLLDKIKRIKFNPEYIRRINYFPFETPYIYYDKDLIGRPFYKTMQHFLSGQNYGIVVPRQNKENGCGFITDKIIGQKLFSAYDINYVFPLYLYSDKNQQLTTTDHPNRVPNLNREIVDKIGEGLDMSFVAEKDLTPALSKGEGGAKTFSPLDILDYIYAVLHSPAYREKYKEFLKIDFPRVPYPTNADTFNKLVALGGQLRQLHLLESAVVNMPITQYPVDGSNMVGKIKASPSLPTSRDGLSKGGEYVDVFINYDKSVPPSGVRGLQYFANVPQVAWEFYIGGYQPAQKWLKDRKGRVLEFEDILHYQKIIVALAETARIMGEVDEVLEL